MNEDDSRQLSRLWQHDISWHIVYMWWDIAIIQNNTGRRIEAPTLQSAIEAALALYGGE